jgi:hypothetical protein
MRRGNGFLSFFLWSLYPLDTDWLARAVGVSYWSSHPKCQGQFPGGCKRNVTLHLDWVWTEKLSFQQSLRLIIIEDLQQDRSILQIRCVLCFPSNPIYSLLYTEMVDVVFLILFNLNGVHGGAGILTVTLLGVATIFSRRLWIMGFLGAG